MNRDGMSMNESLEIDDLRSPIQAFQRKGNTDKRITGVFFSGIVSESKGIIITASTARELR
jgi:hypothetical protein